MNLKAIYQRKKHYQRLIQMVKDSWLKLVVSMGCMLIISASSAATAYLIRPVLDEIFFNKDLQMLKLIPIAVILLYTVRSVAMFAQQYLMSHIGQNIIRQLSNMLYNRIQDLPLAFFQKEKTVSLVIKMLLGLGR